MGDRGNIVVLQQNGESIYFYSHWGGSELPVTLQRALQRGKQRWEDEQYLNRIIFSQMILDSTADTPEAVKAAVESELNLGITTYLCDNEHALVKVWPQRQQVWIGSKQWSFAEYVAQDPVELLTFFEGERAELPIS